MSSALTCDAIYNLVGRIISACFFEPAFGLGSRFAPYLNLSRDQILRIFLQNRQETSLEVTRLLSMPLEPGPLALHLRTLPLDLQVCLLDRLLYAAGWIDAAKQDNAATGHEDQTYPYPEVLIEICTERYLKDEVHRWLSSNSLPELFIYGPELLKKRPPTP